MAFGCFHPRNQSRKNVHQPPTHENKKAQMEEPSGLLQGLS